ncbi:MAG: Crp/Fnr family transcriptional regulator [Chitinophagaceae bacterium]
MLEIFKTYIQGKGEVSDEQFELVKPLLKPMKVNKGTLLLKKGEICHYFSFVAKGCLRSYIRGDNNKVHILEFAPENRWLGDSVSMFRETGSMFYIDAVEDTEMLLLGKDFFTEMPVLFPDFYLTYIHHMHISVRNIHKRLVHLLGSSGHERYLDFIETYPDLGVRLPQHMIASYLGVSPESLSRIRNRLSHK